MTRFGMTAAGILTLTLMSAVCASAADLTLSTSVFVTGDTMQILEQGRKTKFLGHVKIASQSNQLEWEAFGDEGLYESALNRMTLWGRTSGRARLIRHPIHQKNPITLEVYGHTLQTDSNMTFFQAEGNAYGIDTSTTTRQFLRFWAERARYTQADALILLSGAHPLLIIDQPSERRTVTGDVIRYLINDRKLISEGNAVSKILPGPHEVP